MAIMDSGSVTTELFVIVKLKVALAPPSLIVAGPVLMMLMIGATLVPSTTWTSEAIAELFSSSMAVTVTMLVYGWMLLTVTTREMVNEKLAPGARTIGLPPLATSASGSRSPKRSSLIDVTVTGSVIDELFVIVIV